jgi:uncharacterized protein YqcC (DUF446 family)
VGGPPVEGLMPARPSISSAWPAGSIAPPAASGKTGRPPFAVDTMLRIHFLQQWIGLCLTLQWKKPFQLNQLCPRRHQIHLLEKFALARSLGKQIEATGSKVFCFTGNLRLYRSEG